MGGGRYGIGGAGGAGGFSEMLGGEIAVDGMAVEGTEVAEFLAVAVVVDVVVARGLGVLEARARRRSRSSEPLRRWAKRSGVGLAVATTERSIDPTVSTLLWATPMGGDCCE
jgi:hypothetical protein